MSLTPSYSIKSRSALVTTDVSCAHVSSTVGVGLTDELATLHGRLMECLEPFRDRANGDDAQDAFWTDGTGPRPADIEWVARFRERSAFQQFDPHITIGAGPLASHVAPTPFLATQLALCHLGRFCTCRRVLHAWTLAGPTMVDYLAAGPDTHSDSSPRQDPASTPRSICRASPLLRS